MTMPDSAPEPAARVVDGERDAHAETAGAPGPGNGRPSGSEAPAAAPGGERGAGAAAGEVPHDGYRVTLDRFEGPLDLLLYLIQRDEIDVCDIPIAHITDQYLASIEGIERLELDLDRAGDFLLMAATLMRIKARMLLPREEGEGDEEEGIDPREELMRRLVEYHEYKRVAEALQGREEEWREIFFRPGSLRPAPAPDEFPDLGVSLLDLFRAFRAMLAELGTESPLAMGAEEYSVAERIVALREALAAAEDGVPFRRLFERGSRAMLIATFLALLELIRLREIAAEQVDRFGEIWIRRKKEDVVAP